jgi:hypothetical protein
MKKNYSEPTVTKINLDTEINLVLMSDPPADPTGMMMNNSEQTDGGMFSQFINPMKWFK